MCRVGSDRVREICGHVRCTDCTAKVDPLFAAILVGSKGSGSFFGGGCGEKGAKCGGLEDQEKRLLESDSSRKGSLMLALRGQISWCLR